MADWYNITDAQVDPDAPLTSELAYAWRDNPIAITEGAAGAPYEYAVWRPYTSQAWGDGNAGLLYDNATDGNVASVTSPTLDIGWDYMLLLERIALGNGVVLNVNINRGGSFSTAQAIEGTITGAPSRYGTICIEHPMTSRVVHRVDALITRDGGGGTSATADSRSIAWRGGSAAAVSQIRLLPASGNITDGRIWLYRRRANGGGTA